MSFERSVRAAPVKMVINVDRDFWVAHEVYFGERLEDLGKEGRHRVFPDLIAGSFIRFLYT